MTRVALMRRLAVVSAWRVEMGWLAVVPAWRVAIGRLAVSS